MIIANASNKSIKAVNGTVPDVSGAMHDWFQPMVFVQVSARTAQGFVLSYGQIAYGLTMETSTAFGLPGFQVVETKTPINYQGVIQPLDAQELAMLPEGQRAWRSWLLHAEPVLSLKVDDIVIYDNVSYRVKSLRDYSLYNYMTYSLLEDWVGG